MSDLSELNRCRLCSSPNHLSDAIFPAEAQPNEKLISQIYDCTSIRITVERDFPCAICSGCVRIVGQFYSFRSKCLANERELRRARGEPVEDEEEQKDQRDSKQRDEKFYQQIREEVKEYLEGQVKQIEARAVRKAMSEPRDGDNEEALLNGAGGAGGNSSDWKNKYQILHKNNELLQQSFKEQKDKLKKTENMLKVFQESPSIALVPSLSGTISLSAEEASEKASKKPTKEFTEHPALPGITGKFLHVVNKECEPGVKGDKQFVVKVAMAAFGEETMMNSSVCGKRSMKHPNIPAKPPLCPETLTAIQTKLFERVQLEIGPFDHQELMVRTDMKIIKLTLSQKVANMRRPTGGSRKSLPASINQTSTDNGTGADSETENEKEEEQEGAAPAADGEEDEVGFVDDISDADYEPRARSKRHRSTR